MGGFSIGPSIGKGGGGEVFAVHTPVGDPHPMCIKVIPSMQSSVFRRETEVMDRLRHGNPAGTPVSVMNYITSGRGQFPRRLPFVDDVYFILFQRHLCDMYHVIQRRLLGVSAATGFLAQVVHGLQHMHLCGVAHRDIKPENLLVRRDLDVTITDYGTSTDRRRSTTKCGTAGYVAPEVYTQDTYDTFAVDVWSAGITFCVSMTAEFPFGTAACAEERGRVIDRFGCSCSEEICSCTNMEPTRNLLRYLLHADPSSRLRPSTLTVHLECQWAMRDEIRKALGDAEL